MADFKTIPIPLCLPRDEAMALAQFVKRVDFNTVASFSAPCVTYEAMPESDVTWSAIRLLRVALAVAGFAQR